MSSVKEEARENDREDAGERMRTSSFPRRSMELSATHAARLIRDAIEAGGELWVSGAGRSMHPTIHHADLVLLTPLKRQAKRGDIVLVPLGSRLMLHRIATIREHDVLTRGDARDVCDSPVPRRDLLARAIAVRGTGGLAPLAPTLRFGPVALVRFALRELRRRARHLRRRIALLRLGARGS